MKLYLTLQLKPLPGQRHGKGRTIVRPRQPKPVRYSYS